MPDSVYKIIELVGSSTVSWEKAAAAAVERAGQHLRDLRIAEVVQLDMHLKDGKVETYRAKLKASFKYKGQSARLNRALIEQELAAAEAAWKDANEGKARICARRAVALATGAWLTRHSELTWRGDAMEHLRRIQQEASFPLPIRQAAERLTTTVSR